jgi:hypothetical protein
MIRSSWALCLRCQLLPLRVSFQPSASSSPLRSSVSLLFASPSSPRASSTPLSALPRLDQVSSITLDTASSLRPGSPSALPCLPSAATAPSCSRQGAVIVPVTLPTTSIAFSAHASASLPLVADGLRLSAAGTPDPAPGSPLHVPDSPTTTPCLRASTSASSSPCHPTPPPTKDLHPPPSSSLVATRLQDQVDTSSRRRPASHSKTMLRFQSQDNPIPTHNPPGPLSSTYMDSASDSQDVSRAVAALASPDPQDSCLHVRLPDPLPCLARRPASSLPPAVRISARSSRDGLSAYL